MHILWTASLLSAAAFAQSPLQNPGFEEGKPGESPAGWSTGNVAYSSEIVAGSCNSGRQCALLKSTGATGPATFGTLMQTFDATPYRGKKFRYRAAVRTEVSGPRNQAELWLRVDRASHRMGFFDNMGDRPITSAAWKFYEIAGEIDRDAEVVNLGILLAGSGSAWMDDASFEITGDADPVEPPRPFTATGLENMQAFARLFGYIRYFHPSDAAAAADWNRIAIEGARGVEAAATPAELAAKLTSVFAAVGPTVRVFPTGSTPPMLKLTPTAHVISWVHNGVGLNPQSIYRSTREIRDTAQAGDSLQPFRANLPGGVTCLVPIALYRDTATAPQPYTFPGKPGGSQDDRATRLAAVIVAWNIPQHFYPYFDVVHTDWPAALRSALLQAAEDKDGEAFLNTLRRMIAALHDGHGNVNPPLGVDVPRFVPPVLWTWAENRIVALVVKDISELRPGDAIVSIDGKPAADVLAAKETLISGATPQWIRQKALADLLARPRGGTVRLEVESPGDPFKRRNITLQCSELPGSVQELRPEKVKELEPGIFYIDIGRIDDADYAAALPALEKAKSIVFDFRGYPQHVANAQAFFGHLIDKPAASAQWHIPHVTRPDREGMTFERRGEWELPPVAPYLTAKRAFITDGRAISYAESCLGIIENYKLGAIVGEPTAGTNGNINFFTTPGGYTIVFTGMKVLKHDGSQHHGVGIHPTIPVSRTRAGIAAGRDEMIERAVLAVKQ